MATRKKARRKSTRETERKKKKRASARDPSPRKKKAKAKQKPAVKSRAKKPAPAKVKKSRAAEETKKRRGRSHPPIPSAPVQSKRRETPSRWYLDLGKREAREMFPDEGDSEQQAQAYDFRVQTVARKRALEVDYLRNAVKKIRPLVTGFEASDGFDLRHPERWTKQQADKVRAFSQELGSILSQSHVIARPRSKQSREALEVFTGQRFKGQKGWIVHVPKPDETTVRVKGGKVEISRAVRGAQVLDRFYLFEEIFGIKPDTWDDILEMTRILIGKKRYRDSYLYDEDYASTVRKMPDGFYTLWVETQGDTGAPVRRELLLDNLTFYEQAYGNKNSDTWKGGGFEEVILGFHWQGLDGSKAMQRRMQLVAQRLRAEKERKLERARHRRKVTRRASL